MSLLAEYRSARHDEDVARLRRVLSLRAMSVAGMSQRQIAEAVGITQPAVSQQLKFAQRADHLHPEVLLEAAAPVLRAIAAEHGYTRLAVFGSVARHQARPESDIDLIVEAPPGTSSFDLIRFRQLLEAVLGREIDLVEYGGLKPGLDDDIRREAVLL
jgi:predicted nucleotidyltransferase